jgi:4-hydroxythreonine-4-phosphate dehydrogenase
MGDPAGIGPEIAVMALSRPEVFSSCMPVVYGDVNILRRAAAAAKVSIEIVPAGDGNQPTPGRIAVLPVSSLPLEDIPFGKVTGSGSRAMAEYIRAAAGDVLGGNADAIVTCPITKEGLKLAGVPHPGHTEYLAELCGGAEVVMMLAGNRLRVALVTVHVSLRRALELLSPRIIEKTIRITDKFFRKYMGSDSPRIAVAGVNPHAGEGGLFGSEESAMVAPAVSACARDGIGATGPYPPDTIFHRAWKGEFDVVVAMTHDQGLIPLKLAHFEDGVNVSMGLPIVRTSVDHGTAYDIAGKGSANPASLLAAIRMAAEMAKVRR